MKNQKNRKIFQLKIDIKNVVKTCLFSKLLKVTSVFQISVVLIRKRPYSFGNQNDLDVSNNESILPEQENLVNETSSMDISPFPVLFVLSLAKNRILDVKES